MKKADSGAKKRARNKQAQEAAVKNTADISTFLIKKPKVQTPEDKNIPNTEQETEEDRKSENAEQQLELHTEHSESIPGPSASESESSLLDAGTSASALSIDFSDELTNSSHTADEPAPHTSVPNVHVGIDLKLKHPTDCGNFTPLILLPHRSLAKEILAFGPCQPIGPFPQKIQNGKKRSFSKAYYEVIQATGLKISRTWLCYSPILDKAYCEPCWLFANRIDQYFRKEWMEGIDDWHHLSTKIERDETSGSHLKSMVAKVSFTSGSFIDVELEKQIQSESSFWRQILQRIFHIILTLSSANMAFRGDKEKHVRSPNPKGNFLKLVTLLSRFDPVLKSLVESEEQKIKYLSPLIQNEIISILSSALKLLICDEINNCPFFSLIVDSTVDIRKVDQNQSAGGFEEIVLNALEENKIDITKCRGQGYDGASTMSGHISGLQTRIKARSENADYVHCAAHNLNLTISDGVKAAPGVSNFFDTLQCLFTFLHASVCRWSVLDNICKEAFKNEPKPELYKHSQLHKTTLKKLCETRWEARHNSVFAVKLRYIEILKALTKIILTSKKPDEVSTAIGIKKKLEKFEFLTSLVFWERILRPLKLTSKKIQNSDMDIGDCLKYWQRSLSELENLQTESDVVFREAKDLALKWGVPAEFEKKRQIRRKRFFDEIGLVPELVKSPEDKFKSDIFEPVLSKLVQQLRERFVGIREIYSLFEFLTPQKLSTLSDDELTKCVYDFRIKYEKDVSSNLLEQILSFVSCMRDEVKKMKTIKEVANCLLKYDITDSFPDLYLACLLFLTIPVTAASAERSFSKVKLIKNYLRNSMTQERLTNLAILNIESGRTDELEIDKLITQFANAKARRRPII